MFSRPEGRSQVTCCVWWGWMEVSFPLDSVCVKNGEGTGKASLISPLRPNLEQ